MTKRRPHPTDLSPARDGKNGRVGDAVATVFGSLIVALSVTVYSISWAVILYAGDLSAFLQQGIALTLLGSAVVAVVYALTRSLPAGVAHGQDTGALVILAVLPSLSAAVGDVATDAARFATTAAFVAITTILTGGLLWFSGRLRLGGIVRFVPYPVVTGLLVSVGYLLVVSSVGLFVDDPLAWSTFGNPEFAQRLAPWALGAVGLLLIEWRLKYRGLLPLGLVAGLCIFYAWMAVTGLTLDDAAERGLLLGPFPGSHTGVPIDPAMAAAVDWLAILRHLDILLVLFPMIAILGLLNAQSIGQATGTDLDLNRDLRAIGLANIAGGAAGGLVGLTSISVSLLNRRLAIPPMLGAFASAALMLALAVFGLEVLGWIPVGFLALLMLYLGLMLLTQIAAGDGRRLHWRDWMPIIAILLATALIDLPAGLAVGMLLAGVQFVVSYARVPFIRWETTLALRRSVVERPEAARLHLTRVGDATRVIELSGYLFFGSAHKLSEHLHAVRDRGPLDALVLDFRTVWDVDVSASASLARMLRDFGADGIALHLSGLQPRVADSLRRFDVLQAGGATVHNTLDDALQTVEAQLLASFSTSAATRPGTFLDELAQAVPDCDLEALLPQVTVPPGAALMAEGARSDAIYILLDGRAQAAVTLPSGGRLMVARFEPGALVGEMAFYQGVPRSASVVAEGRLTALRIDAGRLRAGGDLPEALVIAFHRLAARHLSQRLERANGLLRTVSG